MVADVALRSSSIPECQLRGQTDWKIGDHSGPSKQLSHNNIQGFALSTASSRPNKSGQRMLMIIEQPSPLRNQFLRPVNVHAQRLMKWRVNRFIRRRRHAKWDGPLNTLYRQDCTRAPKVSLRWRKTSTSFHISGAIEILIVVTRPVSPSSMRKTGGAHPSCRSTGRG